MNTFEFLSTLRDLGVKVWVEGERLRCKAPAGVLTPDIAEKLKTRKLEIINALQSASAGETPDISPPAPSERDGHPPLSFAQERLWFLAQVDRNSSAYNITANRRLSQRIDREALQNTLDEIVRRHEVLRTTFSDNGAGPVQVIHAPGPVDLEIVDLRQLAEPDQAAELHRLAQEAAHRLFDLAAGPLFRATLFTLAEDDHVFYISSPHIVSDGWSIGVFFAEFAFSMRRTMPETLRRFRISHFSSQTTSCGKDRG